MSAFVNEMSNCKCGKHYYDSTHTKCWKIVPDEQEINIQLIASPTSLCSFKVAIQPSTLNGSCSIQNGSGRPSSGNVYPISGTRVPYMGPGGDH
jgi:hypothetical protein